MVGDEARYRDHPVALGHYRVVEFLDRRPEIIGAVEGGHETGAGSPTGVIRRPGRGTAARVHDIDSLRRDQRGERIDIRMHGQRILGMQRQFEMLGPDPFQVVLHAAAARRHQGPAAGGDDRFGDVDGPALDAAGVQLRQDLQHHGRPRRCGTGLQIVGHDTVPPAAATGMH